MSKFFLVKFSKDWADEFSAEGHRALTEEEVATIESLRDNLTEVSFGFGSNEGWDDIPISELVEALEIQEISKEQYDVIVDLFGEEGFGIFPDFVELFEYYIGYGSDDTEGLE